MTVPENQPHPNLGEVIANVRDLLVGVSSRAIRLAGVLALVGAGIMSAGCEAIPSTPSIPPTPAETSAQFAQGYMIGHIALVRNGAHQCSGGILDGPDGQPAAVVTAAQCGFRNASDRTLTSFGEPWVPTGQGTYTITLKSPVAVQTGATADTLSSPTGASEIIVPSPTNPNNDTAIIVLPGHSAKEALSLYEANLLKSSDQRNALKQGATLYMAGWPLGIRAAQLRMLTLTTLGPTTSSYGDIHYPVQNTGDPANEPPCVPGMVGSEAFAVFKDSTAPSGYRAEVVGVLSGIIENVDQQYASICQISTTQLNARNSATLTPILRTSETSEEHRTYATAPSHTITASSAA